MKIFVGLLALISCAAALPADSSFETPEELDLSKLVPKDIFLEPIGSKSEGGLPGGRIVGGTEVPAHSVPYQAAVIINNSGFCGGSLISATRVLTAAHCTDGASFVQVRLGAHAFNTNEVTQIRVTSTSFVIHENFDVGGFAANDVSVIFLPSAVTLSGIIDTIHLAPTVSGTFAGSTGFLSGWGRTSDSSPTVSPILRGIDLNVISNSVCTLSYGSNILSSSLCTSGAGGVGSCNGDSGGPLVVDGTQIGIVSFGAVDCEAGHPSVFARVSSFRHWIAEKSGV